MDSNPAGIKQPFCNAVVAYKPKRSFLTVLVDKLDQHSNPAGIKQPFCNAVVAYKPKGLWRLVSRHPCSHQTALMRLSLLMTFYTVNTPAAAAALFKSI